MDFVDEFGYGNCRMADEKFALQYSCYVKNTSSCKDTLTMDSAPDKVFSAEACRNHFVENSKFFIGY